MKSVLTFSRVSMPTFTRCYSIKPKKSLLSGTKVPLRSLLIPKTPITLKSVPNDLGVNGQASKGKKHYIQPTVPARTRFAPSPTGFLHMGSLRTALYNYLLAKSTGGQFVLRVEDTDQTRLVPGAEANIFETLHWCGMTIDEGPVPPQIAKGQSTTIEKPLNVSDYGPYRQSERSEIYLKYAQKLLDKGLAYRCFCPKERLDKLTESAKKLKPPTTVSYDRHCSHVNPKESVKKATEGKEGYTIRFKSPKVYPPFTDLLHGVINLQPQVNINDVRYEDPILIKSDGMPTYHFANVVDDHLMKITHVIRGEEWLPSTPKHIALYEAFGWAAPNFIHIPLLTSTSEKKLSKRSGDSNVLTLKEKGIFPEALVNFCVLFGWSPVRDTPGETSKEVYEMEELIKLFSLNELTKGNAKVDDKKLHYFNKVYLHKRLQDPVRFNEILNDVYNNKLSQKYSGLSLEKASKILAAVGQNLTTVNDLDGQYHYLFAPVEFSGEHATEFLSTCDKKRLGIILKTTLTYLTDKTASEPTKAFVNEIFAQACTKDPEIKKKDVFQTLRFALAGGEPGLKLNLLADILGPEETLQRVREAAERFAKMEV